MKVNKSAAIREALQDDPKAKVAEIVATLGKRGVEVKPQLVYLIKGNEKKRVRKAKRQVAVRTAADGGIANPVQLIVGVRKLAEQAGGLGQLKQLVDILAT